MMGEREGLGVDGCWMFTKTKCVIYGDHQRNILSRRKRNWRSKLPAEFTGLGVFVYVGMNTRWRDL